MVTNEKKEDGYYLARLGVARREAVRQLAAIEGSSMAEIVQRAIDAELTKNTGRTMVLGGPAPTGWIVDSTKRKSPSGGSRQRAL
jgi:hypothetical protein